MAILNRKICVEGGGGNTGFGDCVLSFTNVVGAFLVPSGKRFTPADLADFQATLQASARAANPRDRIYPIHNLDVPSDNTEDLTIQTTPYGSKYPVREGDYDWTFQFFQGGFCLLKALRSHNGTGKSALFYDANGVIFGQKIGDELAGIPLVFFWANPWRISDGSNASVYAVRFVFKPRYINDDIGFVDGGFNPAVIEGLQDVALREGAGSARPALKVTATTGCGGDNMYDFYPEELAAVSAWVATINGLEVVITSVAEDAALKGWTITLDTEDENYSASDPIVITMADPADLEQLGVTGFESKKLTIS